jgi:hypothetical protein
MTIRIGQEGARKKSILRRVEGMFPRMRGKILLWVRRTHLFLSVFFAPLLLLFVITGWAQTMNFDHSTSLMQSLSRVHTDQYYPMGMTNGRPSFDNQPQAKGEVKQLAMPTRWLVAAMCVALLVSISLGLVLAFTMVRNRIPIWIALFCGIAAPVLLLTLAHVK